MSRTPYIPSHRPIPVNFDEILKKALIFHQCGNYQEARIIYEQVIRSQPKNFNALQLLGALLVHTKEYEYAAKILSRSLQIDSKHAIVQYNLGVALQQLAMRQKSKFEEALVCYNIAINLNPNVAEFYNNRGFVLKDLKFLEEAVLSFETALKINPNYKFLRGNLQHLKMIMSDWRKFDEQITIFCQKISANEMVIEPFAFLTIADRPSELKTCTEIYVKETFPRKDCLGPIPKRLRQKKIRIAYFSGDFREHPVSSLMAQLFEMHDKNKFEVYGFSFGPDDKSEIRTRVINSFDRFIDISELSDIEVVKLARDLNVDIAVNLSGFTAGNRTGIFSYRIAPIQLSYLGYLGTMGTEYMDYLIADRTIIPENFIKFYSEKILYLPNYNVYDSQRKLSDKNASRKELGLPDKGFIFAAFNNNYKITPEIYSSWMHILNSVQGSILWLFVDNPWAVTNLKNEAANYGIDVNRLVFATRLSQSEHLARYYYADLFLDTYPCNAGSTAVDALWAGLPVLTLMGNSFASRVAASSLNAISMPELITTSQKDYEVKAIELATNPDRLLKLKKKLSKCHSNALLFNTALNTKHLEDGYLKIMQRYWEDLPVDHILNISDEVTNL
ncbi:tetratricopeptide repeat protein [Polynucleobacter paneuropaeus]|nr:tetratricopeptide repeat protein [Polynucleobacter paneuropaeus]